MSCIGLSALLGTSLASAEPPKPTKTAKSAAQVRFGVGLELSTFLMPPVNNLINHGQGVLVGVKLDRLFVGLGLDYFAAPSDLNPDRNSRSTATAGRFEVQVALLRSSDAQTEALLLGALGWPIDGAHTQEGRSEILSSFGPWRAGGGVRYWPIRWLGLSLTTGVLGYEEEYTIPDGRASQSTVALFGRFGVMGAFGW